MAYHSNRLLQWGRSAANREVWFRLSDDPDDATKVAKVAPILTEDGTILSYEWTLKGNQRITGGLLTSTAETAHRACDAADAKLIMLGFELEGIPDPNGMLIRWCKQERVRIEWECSAWKTFLESL